jgi:hypothetical protein
LCDWQNHGKNAEGADMTKRAKREKDQWDRLLEQIDFHGMTRDKAVGPNEVIKQLTGRILQRP